MARTCVSDNDLTRLRKIVCSTIWKYRMKLTISSRCLRLDSPTLNTWNKHNNQLKSIPKQAIITSRKLAQFSPLATLYLVPPKKTKLHFTNWLNPTIYNYTARNGWIDYWNTWSGNPDPPQNHNRSDIGNPADHVTKAKLQVLVLMNQTGYCWRL